MLGKWFGKSDDKVEASAVNIGEKLTPQELAKLPDAVKQQIQNPDTVAVFKTPENQTSRSKFFRFNGPEGLDLSGPGKQILIVIEDGQKINLQDVFLGHKKKQQYWGDTSQEWDANGAYTEVLVFDGKTNSWRQWQDPLGHDPVKYAERRKTVEYEKLSNYFGMLGEVKPLAFLLISRGKGDAKTSVVTEHSLELMSYPDMHPGIKSLESNYSPGNRFVDFSQPGGPNRLPVYGGGKQHHKKGPQNASGGPAGYPQSIPLGGKVGVEPFPMTENLHTATEHLDEEGKLWISLPAGKKIKALEVSAGARWWNELPHPSLASKGGRKISAYIVGKDGNKKDQLMRSLNVGPQGVLMGGPTEEGYVTQEGDRLLIEGEAHTSYLMGWRLLYEDGPASTGSDTVTAGATATAEVAKMAVQTPLNLKPTTDAPPGGTQGAKWYMDSESGKRYVGKTYENSGSAEKAKDRCASEFIANRIYRLMGIPAPESHIQNNMVFSKEIEGLQKFPYSWNAQKDANISSAKAFYGNSKDLKDGFVVDAWLANWDVFGLEYDNVLKDPEGKMVRVDGGGSMFFRGMGQHKPQFDSEVVGEIDTMRDPKMAREAGSIYKDLVNEDDIKAQVTKLCAVMTDSVISNLVNMSGISNSTEVIQTLIKRRNWLAKKYAVQAPAPAPAQSPAPAVSPAPVMPQSSPLPPGPASAPSAAPSSAPALLLTSTGKKIGSSGVEHTDPVGKHYLVKEYGGNVDRCATEYIACKLYEKMGIPTIDAQMQNGRFVSRMTPGLSSPGSTSAYNHPDIINGFVMDCWLANWNVFGLNLDYVRKSSEGKMIRTSNQGSLFFRANGESKPGFADGPVQEIESMRNPSTQAGKIYQPLVKDMHIRAQVKKLATVMTDSLISEVVESSGISNSANVIQALIKRRNWLMETFK